MILLSIALTGLGLTVWWRSAANERPSDRALQASAAVIDAAYVGGRVCADCHPTESLAWTGSHHDLAMQEPSAGSVRGDFDGATFRYAGITSVFTRRAGRFYVRTDGPDGELADYQIAYTFGVYPLQQYLIALPGGRLQALSIAWDSRPAADGGQRWFHLYPDDAITAGHPLHWTGLRQNWNFTCAECHSTNLKKGYDAAANVYRTTWSEIDVSCEACHGPGSGHVAWAKQSANDRWTDATKGLTVALDERRGITWRPDIATGNATRSSPRQSSREIDTCARCHGRSSRLTDDDVHGRRRLDTHKPALLDDGLYWADGQMRGEVYNWGSFVQSRMHAKGVTCADCHEPHSLELRAPGNAVCAQCHLASKYDDERHTRHAAGAPAAACVSCHMPVTTYMQVDPRHDHSFRVPRPELSASLGIPNACNACHTDKPPAWAAAAIAGWTGRTPRTGAQVANAFQAASAGAPAAPDALVAIVNDRTLPAIVRASALRRLASWPTLATLRSVADALRDPEDLVRMAAVEALADADPAVKARELVALLADPARAVRSEAAAALAGPPERWMAAGDRARFEAALAEYEATLRYNADRPDARLSLGNLFMTRGDAKAASAAYRSALSLDPSFAAAYVNLADMFRAGDAEREAETILREGLERAPQAAALHHALALSLVRQQRRSEALASLATAARLDPDVPRYAYTYALALRDAGQAQRAIAVLEAALERHPHDRELQTALASVSATGSMRGSRGASRE